MSESSAPTKKRSPRWWNIPAVGALTSDALIALARSACVPMPNTAVATAPANPIVLDQRLELQRGAGGLWQRSDEALNKARLQPA
jgi:hypothetical protein